MHRPIPHPLAVAFFTGLLQLPASQGTTRTINVIVQ